jgi:hypothetical protein
MFYNDYTRVFLVFQMYVACVSIVSNVRCKCFNCFECMLQVFHLNAIKVDLGVAHVAVGPICSSHLLQLLGLPAKHMSVERAPRCESETRSGAGHERARATVRARDTE